jgi:DNA-binding transcriptional regulator YhcF (GntR family)
VRATLDDGRPLFLQIKESIEEDILSGALRPDEQIPSNRQLVAFYNVNPMTVLKGVGLLAEEGILYKKRGTGMFVARDAPARLRRRFCESFGRDRIEPLVRLAVSLGIGRDELRAMIDEAWKGASS